MLFEMLVHLMFRLLGCADDCSHTPTMQCKYKRNPHGDASSMCVKKKWHVECSTDEVRDFCNICVLFELTGSRCTQICEDSSLSLVIQVSIQATCFCIVAKKSCIFVVNLRETHIILQVAALINQALAGPKNKRTTKMIINLEGTKCGPGVHLILLHSSIFSHVSRYRHCYERVSAFRVPRAQGFLIWNGWFELQTIIIWTNRAFVPLHIFCGAWMTWTWFTRTAER